MPRRIPQAVRQDKQEVAYAVRNGGARYAKSRSGEVRHKVKIGAVRLGKVRYAKVRIG